MALVEYWISNTCMCTKVWVVFISRCFSGPWLCFSPLFFVSHSAFPLKCSIICTPYLPFLTFALSVLKAKSQDNNRHINKLDLSPAVLLYHLHHTAWKCVCSWVRDPYCIGLSRRMEKNRILFLSHPLSFFSCSLSPALWDLSCRVSNPLHHTWL